MEVKDYEDLKKMLCKELEDIKNRRSLGMAEIEIIDKLTHSIKSIDKIMEDEEGGYSQAGYYARAGEYGNGNSRNSYASRRGMHYVRGHYSRGDGYSYGDGMDQIVGQMESLMNDPNTTDSERSTLRRAMNMLNQ